ncbi:MAG: hypothetical protein H7A23_06160 [Leptospiraceae bacterium]|nr:hypothetical protein [Leptospiraceae bacterium]
MKNRIYFNNPEFSKNVWLELSLNRLVLMPIILLMILLIVFISNDNLTERMKLIQIWCVVIFLFLICVWGTKLSSESVINEINERTWDDQKLTLLTPETISWGKLFGSTIYQWYGGGICLVIFLIVTFFTQNFVKDLKLLSLLILVGVFTHSSVISASLVSIKRNSSQIKLKSTPIFMGGLLLGFFLTSYSWGLMEANAGKFTWYGIDFKLSNFLLISLLFFLFWNIVGLYQNMKYEFRFSTGIIVWITFLASLIIYLNGFLSNLGKITSSEGLTLGSGISFIVCVVFTYLLILLEPKYIVDFRLLIDKFQKQDWYKFQINLPLWLVSLFFSIIFGFILFMLSVSLNSYNLQNEGYSIVFPINLIFFVLRDTMIFLFFNLSPNSKRADLTAVFYLLVLYGLIPSFLYVAELKILYPIFFPTFESNFMLGTIPIFIQFIIMLFFTVRRFKKEGIVLQKTRSSVIS